MELYERCIFEYISFSTNPSPNVIVTRDFQSINGSLRLTCVVWLSEPVHVGEPVPTHIIQSLFIEEFTILPSQVKERSDFVRSGTEPVSLI